MKDQYPISMFDDELNKLDANIIWKKANSNELKYKLITDMNKLAYRAKIKKIFSYSIRLSALVAFCIITFNFVKHDNFLFNQFSSDSLNHKGINRFQQPILEQGKANGATEKQNELYKIVTIEGNRSLVLTDETSIPLTVNETIPSIIGKPVISANKDNNHVQVSVFYPINGDRFITIHTTLNEQGSEKPAYDSLVKMYPNSGLAMSFAHHHALLSKPKDAYSEPQLFIVTDKFIYYISGGKSDEDLIKIADLIRFNN